MDEGEKIYSAMLAQSLGAAGATVTFLGFGDDGAQPDITGVNWIAVPGQPRSKASAFLSVMPLAAAVCCTSAYKSLLRDQLRKRWDALLLDGYGSGWALKLCLGAMKLSGWGRPHLVYMSKNHEELLWRNMARGASGSFPRRLALRQNYCKVRALERRIVRKADLVTAITEEDRHTLGALAEGKHILTLTPGYNGWVAQQRTVGRDTPRRAILVGSFRWVVKQENLIRFVEVADPVFRRNGIELDVIGDVPEPLLATLRARSRATLFHGFVYDLTPFLARARIAVVPEVIGGGFKLKILDYLFARVPVATIESAAAGVHPLIRREMLCADDLGALVELIVAHMDRIEDLNRMQEAAFDQAKSLFQWEDRGAKLYQTMCSLMSGPGGQLHDLRSREGQHRSDVSSAC
jgi:glycosyltransferase involved in cell wall biosynthesis